LAEFLCSHIHWYVMHWYSHYQWVDPAGLTPPGNGHLCQNRKLKMHTKMILLHGMMFIKRFFILLQLNFAAYCVNNTSCETFWKSSLSLADLFAFNMAIWSAKLSIITAWCEPSVAITLLNIQLNVMHCFLTSRNFRVGNCKFHHGWCSISFTGHKYCIVPLITSVSINNI